MGRELMYDAVLGVHDHLVKMGVSLPPELKRRDPREPGRRQKEMLEDKIAARLLRYWRKQARVIRDGLERTDPDRKALKPPYTWLIEDAFDEEEETELIADLIRILTQAAKGGVDLFKLGIGFDFDTTLTNSKAAEWARKYTYDLVKDIGDTTRRVLQDTIGAFVETPGMTISDVWRSLPFDEARAQMIATTEITRAYASANRIAGKELQKEFPGVRVVKTWFTNNDDLVCDICAPLDGKEIEMDAGFGVEEGEGLDSPPAHPNCRCWMETSTALAELEEEAGAEVAEIPENIEGVTVEKISEGIDKYNSYDDLPKGDSDAVYFLTPDQKLVLVKDTHEDTLWGMTDKQIKDTFGYTRAPGVNPTMDFLRNGGIRVRETPKAVVIQSGNIDKATLRLLQHRADNNLLGLNPNKEIIWGNDYGDEVVRTTYTDFMSGKYVVNGEIKVWVTDA